MIKMTNHQSFISLNREKTFNTPQSISVKGSILGKLFDMAGFIGFHAGDIERMEMDRFEDEVHALEHENWASELWDDSEDLIRGSNKIDTSPQYMNNQDYTLNSPLICDELDAFKDYLRSGKKNLLYYTKSWDNRVEWMKALPIDWSNVKPTECYHKECASLWAQPSKHTSDIINLIRSSDLGAEQTHHVVSTYCKGWLKRDLKFASRVKNSTDTLKYGSYMLELIKISWILNATTVYERDSLQESVGFTYLNNGEKQGGVMYDSKVFGKVYLGGGVLYFQDINMLWDRNMLLMFKDTSTARFHTLFAIQHRYQDKYISDHLTVIEEMYRLGDQVLKYDTISAYESYGMIEPLSSLMLSELAGDFRPLIPRFPHFRNHVEGKISDLSKINPETVPFFEILKKITDKRILLTVYGSSRHWGHPFISYLTGLESLYQNVTSTKEKIDPEYAELLASDLAFKILKKEFWSKFRWHVDAKLMPDNNPLKEHVIANTWPSMDVLLAYPPKWHELPLTPCWEIPEVVDPSIIYSDKTHSIQKSELINHLKYKPNSPIPTRKVLDTLLHSPSTNWPRFLKLINDKGLNVDDLVIGLKAKEREIKWKGRFFALMSWKLREYFVFTEYLIKKNVIPLFKGLTMADDQTTLIKKMLTNTIGQGGNSYQHVTVANHIDYEKWNNFQRYESTAPVFTVLGKFFGMPNLFTRTHEFFQKSLIYYRDRPDLMKVDKGVVVNRDIRKRVCWNGQAGGLEGLRQKGWSVLNLLVIERESRVRNTLVQTLAQGDNQVICTQYEINPSKNEIELKDNLKNVMTNNEVIIDAIRKATAKIGLRINEDETLQSADLLIYGKTVVFRGNLTCLEEKRYSRITCTTNDQLPSLGNIMATVSTNCLTIAHYSKSPINAIMSYNWLGNFVMQVLAIHNPALRTSASKLVSRPELLNGLEYKIAALYLDPSLGGIAGMSLTRFHLRMFPDPVTEGLSFWKIIYHNTHDQRLARLAIKFGQPKLMKYNSKHFAKLLEDPSSLNIPRGLSAQNLIKEEIKRALLEEPNNIKHEVIRDAVLYVKTSEDRFISYLSSIKPCFPRFVSELRSSTYFGLTNAIIGLFENSKTIRNLFKRKFRNMVDTAIVQCELGSIESLMARTLQAETSMWKCSATHADKLRKASWNRDIIGTTVPHPCEMISDVQPGGLACQACPLPTPRSIHVIVIVPQGMDLPEDYRGPYHPYLGSSTGESTSLIQSWEKDTDISFIKKASNMRRSFNWFVEPNSNLGKSISLNLESLTGESSGDTITGFRRTGSALHRFGCSRVSSGGYIANSPVYGSRMIISTDNFQLLGDKNYDFMYQSLMLYAQQTAGEIHNESTESATYHFHIKCTECLRLIEEPMLDSKSIFKFPNVSKKLEKWKPSSTPWMKESISVEIPEGNWEILNQQSRSREVGILQGVVFGNLSQSYSDTNVLNGLFPLAMRNKIHGPSYLMGLRDGLYRAATVDATHRRIFYKAASPQDVIRACYLIQVDRITKHSDFLNFTQGDAIIHTLKTFNHRVPPSYPLNNTDLGLLVKGYLGSYTYDMWRTISFSSTPDLWIFADFLSVQLSGMLIISYELSLALSKTHMNIFKQKAKSLGDLLSVIRNGELQTKVQDIIHTNDKIKLCTQEVRHAIKHAPANTLIPRMKVDPIVFSNKVEGKVYEYPVSFSSEYTEPPLVVVPRKQNPLISGIRIPQIATGAFLKIECLIRHLKLTPADMIVGGDGSGGISASLLRHNVSSRLIFNSLLEMENVDLSGSLPRPPSAIDYMPDNVRDRCVNLNNAWEHSMDLSKEATWKSFVSLKHKHLLRIDLAVFDMEIQNEEMTSNIENLMTKYIPKLLEINSTLIVKTYMARLYSRESILIKVASMFHNVIITQNDMSSSQTSEVYIVMQRLRTRDIIRLYPQWESFQSLRDHAFCMRSYDSEFSRALRVMNLDLRTGIPKVFLPSFPLELTGIWNSISHDRVAICQWSEFISECKASLGPFSITTLGLLANQVIPTSRWTQDNDMVIPGDQELSRYFAYFVGTFLYYALVQKDYDLARKCQSMIDNPFFIFFYSNTHKPKKNHGQLLYSMSWSLHEKKNWIKHKKVFLQHKMALIGSTIRYLLAIFNAPGHESFQKCFDKLLLINKNLTEKHLRAHTGVFDLLK
nr:MAG: putative RNA-dependent RNA polymerase [Ohlsdorf virus]